MAREAHLEVTQPYHGDGGKLEYDVGYRFGLQDVLPDGIHVTPVVTGEPDPPAGPEPKTADPRHAKTDGSA